MPMKIDRLLSITIYLLNNESVSARQLAQHFQVSVRTIQRDMITLSQAGIPVFANSGKTGGYAILPEFKLKNHLLKDADKQLILKALKSLNTSYSNSTLEELIRKYLTLTGENNSQPVFWDFGVTRENAVVQEYNIFLENAIKQNRTIRFHYRNAEGVESERRAQPLAVHYKWYAWYLFFYDLEKLDYRTCKVARMSELQISQDRCTVQHDEVEKLMKESEQKYYRTCSEIEVQCREEEKALLKEYFPDEEFEELPDGKYRMFLHVPQKERLWQALLLSFGNRVKVIGPQEYREKLIRTAQDFLSNYDI